MVFGWKKTGRGSYTSKSGRWITTYPKYTSRSGKNYWTAGGRKRADKKYKRR